MNAFKALYERIFKVLSVEPTLVPTLVPVANVFAEGDPGERVIGNGIAYTWLNSQWDSKAKRGTGVLRVVASAVDNKMVAQDIFEKLRTLLTARTLTGALVAGGGVRVHLFREQQSTADVEQGPDGRFNVSGTYDVKLVETA